MANISQFFKDNKGEFSSMRLVTFTWTLGILVTWMWVCLSKSELLPIDETYIVIILGTITGKIVQKQQENGVKKNESKKDNS